MYRSSLFLGRPGRHQHRLELRCAGAASAHGLETQHAHAAESRRHWDIRACQSVSHLQIGRVQENHRKTAHAIY